MASIMEAIVWFIFLVGPVWLYDKWCIWHGR